MTVSALNPAFVSTSPRRLPLAFGYVLGSGDQFLDIVTVDGSQFRLYILGEGEWDGYEMINTFATTGSTLKSSLTQEEIPAVPPHLIRQTLTFPSADYFAKTAPGVVHFHSGRYTPIGTVIPTIDPVTGLPPINSSNDAGPSQGYDPWFAQFPSVTPPQSFSGIAYAIFGMLPPPSWLRGVWVPTT